MSLPRTALSTPGSSRVKRQFLRRVKQWDDGEEVEVEMTPLIDCVFLLLIFFLVTTMLKKLEKQIPVVLPDSTVALAPVAQRQALILGLDAGGGILIGQGQDEEGNVTYRRVDDLPRLLQETARERGRDLPIRLDAARNTPFQRVIDVLDVCALQGFENVGVRIQHEGKEYHELGDRRSARPARSVP
jgi:biopolymer transport protein ExbD